MKKMIVCSLAVVLTLTLCGMAWLGVQSRGSNIAPAYVDRDAESPSEQDVKRLLGSHEESAKSGGAREIVCWGDSLTEGVGAEYALIRLEDGSIFDASYQSYPQVLQQLTRLPTYNFGVPGATSEEIAVMQGGWESASVLDDYKTIDSEVIDQSSKHLGDILVLELGSNGGWGADYNTLIAQYDAMIAYSGCESFIVIGDTDDPGMSLGDPNQRPMKDGEGPGETAWEAALREAYGDRFINMRAHLIERGLETARLEKNPEDEEDASRGCLSRQLRADWTHLNAYGYYAKAKAVHERGVQLGFWE